MGDLLFCRIPAADRAAVDALATAYAATHGSRGKLASWRRAWFLATVREQAKALPGADPIQDAMGINLGLTVALVARVLADLPGPTLARRYRRACQLIVAANRIAKEGALPKTDAAVHRATGLNKRAFHQAYNDLVAARAALKRMRDGTDKASSQTGEAPK